jgi:hypothetical protein
MRANFKIEDGNLVMIIQDHDTMVSRESLGMWLPDNEGMSCTYSRERSQPAGKIRRQNSNQLCPVCN